MSEERVLTYGEKLVWVSFNPSTLQEVDVVKQTYAGIIDTLKNMQDTTTSSFAKRTFACNH